MLLLRFQGGKIKGMSEKNIGKCLKIHKRIAAAEYRVQQIISLMDDAFGSKHTLATVQGLDMLVTRTNVAGQDTLSQALLLWCVENFKMDVDRESCAPDASKIPFGLCISRALLKKRIINFLHKKLPPPKEGDTWRSIHEIFGTMQKFRDSGLEQGSTVVMPWRSAMPDCIQETVDFITSLVRGGVVDDTLDEFLSKDSLASAELVMGSAAMKSVFDFQGVLEARNADKNKADPMAVEIEQAKTPAPEKPEPEIPDVVMDPPAAED